MLGHFSECPGRRPQDSFPLPVKLFQSWDVHLQPLPTPVCIREQKFLKARPLSAPTRGGAALRSAVPGLELWLQRRASQEDQSHRSWWQNCSFIFLCPVLHLCIRSFFLIYAFINSSMCPFIHVCQLFILSFICPFVQL